MDHQVNSDDILAAVSCNNVTLRILQEFQSLAFKDTTYVASTMETMNAVVLEQQEKIGALQSKVEELEKYIIGISEDYTRMYDERNNLRTSLLADRLMKADGELEARAQYAIDGSFSQFINDDFSVFDMSNINNEPRAIITIETVELMSA